MYKSLSAAEKKALVKRILKGEKVTSIAKEAGVSRTILYKWVAAYKKAGPKANEKPLITHIVKGRSHWKSFSLAKEHLIIKECLRNPSFSAKKIATTLHLSANGVWKVLKRYDLNTKIARENYVLRNGALIF